MFTARLRPLAIQIRLPLVNPAQACCELYNTTDIHNIVLINISVFNIIVSSSAQEKVNYTTHWQHSR